MSKLDLSSLSLPDWVDPKRVSFSDKTNPKDVVALVTALDRIGQEPLAKPAKRRPIQDFTTTELRNELLDRGCTDFSRLQPFIRNALLIVIAAAMLMGYWGSILAGITPYP